MWEIENMDTAVRIARELAENVSVPFAGAVFRPHAAIDALSSEEKGSEILKAAEQAGFELACGLTGKMTTETLSAVSQPLIGQEEYTQYMNGMRADAGE